MIEDGSHVTMKYVLKVDGEEIDSSTSSGPFEYTHGRRQILPGLEEELEGLNAGERKQVALGPEKAYGTPDPDAVRSFPRDAFSNVEQVRAGEMVRGKIGSREFHASVVSVDSEQVLLDMNHPLAGKTLEYDIEIVRVD